MSVGYLTAPAAAAVAAMVRVAIAAQVALVVVLLPPSGALQVELTPPLHVAAPVARVPHRGHGAQAGIPRNRAN